MPSREQGGGQSDSRKFYQVAGNGKDIQVAGDCVGRLAGEVDAVPPGDLQGRSMSVITQTTAMDMSRKGAKVDKDKKVAADIRDETRGEFVKFFQYESECFRDRFRVRVMTFGT